MMDPDPVYEAARAASRERSSAMFIDATYKMCRYFGVPATAFHVILSEDYGRSELRITNWTDRE